MKYNDNFFYFLGFTISKILKLNADLRLIPKKSFSIISTLIKLKTSWSIYLQLTYVINEKATRCYYITMLSPKLFSHYVIKYRF